MRPSFHLSDVHIPNSENTLLLHTLRGAVDIVPREVALALKEFDDSTDLLSEAEIKTLKQRGYLTEQTPEQELEQACAVMRLSSKNYRHLVELNFSFPSQMADEPALDRDKIEDLFALASAMAGDEGMVLSCLDVSAPVKDVAVMEQVLEAALRRDCPIMPTATISGLDAISSWGKSEYFNQLTLVTDSSQEPSDFDGLAAKINDLFERQIHTSWTCRIDGMSHEQLKSILTVRAEVRQKYPTFILYLFADEYEGTSAPGTVTVEGVEVPFISSENETVLRTLMRFILMPSVINYRPFFQPQNQRLDVDLGTGRVTCETASGRTFSGSLNEARAGVESARAEATTTGAPWERAQGASGCLACRYSLVCGRDWIGKGGFADARHCASSFEQRLAQSLPLLLFILRGNWRPLESAKPQAGTA